MKDHSNCRIQSSNRLTLSRPRVKEVYDRCLASTLCAVGYRFLRTCIRTAALLQVSAIGTACEFNGLQCYQIAWTVLVRLKRRPLVAVSWSNQNTTTRFAFRREREAEHNGWSACGKTEHHDTGSTSCRTAENNRSWPRAQMQYERNCYANKPKVQVAIANVF